MNLLKGLRLESFRLKLLHLQTPKKKPLRLRSSRTGVTFVLPRRMKSQHSTLNYSITRRSTRSRVQAGRPPAQRTMAWAAAAFAALWLISACSLLPKEEEVLLPPLVESLQETYSLHEVMRGTVKRSISGRGVFESSVIVSHQFAQGVTGRVNAVYVERGDTVKQGDPLIELDREGLKIALLERERDVLVAQRALDQARASRDVDLVRIRMLELDIAETKRDELQAQMAGSLLTAGIDGVIVSMETVAPGDTVRTGATYVTIVDPDSLRLSYAAVASPEFLEVQVGMKAAVTYNGQVLEAAVTQSPASAPPTDDPELRDKYARTIYFKLDSSDVVPEHGATADVEIVLQQKEDVLIIPRNGIRTLFDRNYVRVLDGESIKEIDIEKGIESPFGIEVVKGLEEGMMVILE